MAPQVEEQMWEVRKELKESNITVSKYNKKFRTNMIAKAIVGHGLAMYALLFKLHYLKLWTIIYTIVLTMLAVLGTTAGSHRLWSHHSYRATRSLRVFLLFCVSLASHFTIKDWVKMHRLHHKYADTEADPHNSRRGFYFAHFGWLMEYKTPEYREKIKEIDVSDVMKDPVAEFQARYFFTISYTVLLVPCLVPLVWSEDPVLSFLVAGLVRYIAATHCALSINSFAHMYGARPYNKNIQPTQSPFVSFVCLGEGWHNYHHTFPWDYRADEFGNTLNLTARFLDLCAKLGLASDLKTASPDIIARVKDKYGDGSYDHHTDQE